MASMVHSSDWVSKLRTYLLTSSYITPYNTETTPGEVYERIHVVSLYDLVKLIYDMEKPQRIKALQARERQQAQFFSNRQHRRKVSAWCRDCWSSICRGGHRRRSLEEEDTRQYSIGPWIEDEGQYPPTIESLYQREKVIQNNLDSFLSLLQVHQSKQLFLLYLLERTFALPQNSPRIRRDNHSQNERKYLQATQDLQDMHERRYMQRLQQRLSSMKEATAGQPKGSLDDRGEGSSSGCRVVNNKRKCQHPQRVSPEASGKSEILVSSASELRNPYTTFAAQKAQSLPPVSQSSPPSVMASYLPPRWPMKTIQEQHRLARKAKSGSDDDDIEMSKEDELKDEDMAAEDSDSDEVDIIVEPFKAKTTLSIDTSDKQILSKSNTSKVNLPQSPAGRPSPIEAIVRETLLPNLLTICDWFTPDQPTSHLFNSTKDVIDESAAKTETIPRERRQQRPAPVSMMDRERQQVAERRGTIAEKIDEAKEAEVEEECTDEEVYYDGLTATAIWQELEYTILPFVRRYDPDPEEELLSLWTDFLQFSSLSKDQQCIQLKGQHSRLSLMMYLLVISKYEDHCQEADLPVVANERGQSMEDEVKSANQQCRVQESQSHRSGYNLRSQKGSGSNDDNDYAWYDHWKYSPKQSLYSQQGNEDWLTSKFNYHYNESLLFDIRGEILVKYPTTKITTFLPHYEIVTGAIVESKEQGMPGLDTPEGLYQVMMNLKILYHVLRHMVIANHGKRENVEPTLQDDVLGDIFLTALMYYPTEDSNTDEIELIESTIPLGNDSQIVHSSDSSSTHCHELRVLLIPIHKSQIDNHYV